MPTLAAVALKLAPFGAEFLYMTYHDSIGDPYYFFKCYQ